MNIYYATNTLISLLRNEQYCTNTTSDSWSVPGIGLNAIASAALNDMVVVEVVGVMIVFVTKDRVIFAALSSFKIISVSLCFDGSRSSAVLSKLTCLFSGFSNTSFSKIQKILGLFEFFLIFRISFKASKNLKNQINISF